MYTHTQILDTGRSIRSALVKILNPVIIERIVAIASGSTYPAELATLERLGKAPKALPGQAEAGRRYWIREYSAEEDIGDIREELGQMETEVKIAFPVSHNTLTIAK